MTVPARVAQYLAGEPTTDPAVLRLGGCIVVDKEPHYDPTQLDCVKRIARALVGDEPIVLLIEGPR